MLPVLDTYLILVKSEASSTQRCKLAAQHIVVQRMTSSRAPHLQIVFFKTSTNQLCPKTHLYFFKHLCFSVSISDIDWNKWLVKTYISDHALESCVPCWCFRAPSKNSIDLNWQYQELGLFLLIHKVLCWTEYNDNMSGSSCLHQANQAVGRKYYHFSTHNWWRSTPLLDNLNFAQKFHIIIFHLLWHHAGCTIFLSDLEQILLGSKQHWYSMDHFRIEGRVV